ncbi:MAG: HD domain-containing protein [Thermoplasmata archaeon]
MKYKTVQDTIHGSIRFYGPFLELLETPEVQRLSGISQLGLTSLVFPGANHTRLEHSMGAYRVAERMAGALGLPEEEKHTVMAAALLHDIGHAPFSHTLESILAHESGKDHMDITKELITGEVFTENRDSPTIPEILESGDLVPSNIAELIKGEERPLPLDNINVHKGQAYFGGEQYLYHMVHGPMDVDQIDYLLRDSHYTGAAHGIIDLERLLQTVEIHNGDLVISKGGVSAVEGMLVARGLMFSSVYLHKTARIAELMLTKGVTPLKEQFQEIYRMVDWELFGMLKSKGGFQWEMVERLKQRRLYKKCFTLTTDMLEDTDIFHDPDFGTIDFIRALERNIASRKHISPNNVIVDIPDKELKLSEPRLEKTNIKVLDDGRLDDMYKYSPLCRALQKRPSISWVLMVSCPRELRDTVEEAARKEIIRR